MKKFAKFIVKFRYYILGIMLALAVVSAFLIPKIYINRDLTKYLPDDSPMKEGIAIMDKEFPGSRTRGNIQVMFKGLDESEKNDIKGQIEEIEYVDSVMYDSSDSYNKDEYTLYVVNCSYDYNSLEEQAVEKAIKDTFRHKDMILQHTSATALTIPFWVYIVVAVVLIVILFFMCSSYFEPLLFLLTTGIAIVINLGTNLIFGSVSDTTFSLSSILQLVLSMDYSIILMNRYKQEKETGLKPTDAMTNAYASALPSILSSAFTTIIGLVVLVLMRFKIGLDLGSVMAKGVAISMISAITVLPALIILCDKLIEKTKKRELPIHTKPLAKFNFKARNVLAICFVVLFVAGICLQGITNITFAQPKDNRINDVFNKQNQVVILYENKKQDDMTAVLDEIEKMDDVGGVFGYSTTIGKELTPEEMTNSLSQFVKNPLDPQLVDFVYYHKYHLDDQLPSLNLTQLVSVTDSPVIASMLPPDIFSTLLSVKPLLNKETLLTPVTADKMADLLHLNYSQVVLIYNQYYQAQTEKPDPLTMAPKVMLDYVVNDLLTNEIVANSLSPELIAKVKQAKSISDLVIADVHFTSEQSFGMLKALAPTIKKEQVDLLYMFYNASHIENKGTMSLYDFVTYLNDTILTDATLSNVIDGKIKAMIMGAKSALQGFKTQMVSDEYSIALILTKLPEESPETTTFINSLNDTLTEKAETGFYVIGNSPMNVEMEGTFSKDFWLITILSAVAIFIIVALTFRSLLIPLMLVLIVQCGVYITIIINGLLGQNIYFLSLLVVQCILMGATIDYGIVFTNNYLENRNKYDILEALNIAFKESIHTILTSSMIIILITGIIGFCPADPAITKICLTIAIGTLCVAILIVFVLPGLLACTDKFITKPKKPWSRKKQIDNLVADISNKDGDDIETDDSNEDKDLSAGNDNEDLSAGNDNEEKK